VEGHHHVERKGLVEGVPSAGLQITQVGLRCKAYESFQLSASTEDLPAPVLCRTVSVSRNCSNHRFMECIPGAFLHIPDDNVFALEQLILSPSTTTQILPWGGESFYVRQLCTFQQRHYQPGNQLTRKEI
jgi:hypothetical protein